MRKVERLSSRERLLAVLDGGEADRPPALPLAGAWIARTSGRPLGDLMARAEVLAEAQIEAQARAGYDALYTYVDPLAVPEAFGCPVVVKEFGGPSIAEDLPLGGPLGALERPIPDPGRDGRLPEIVRATALLAGHAAGRLPVIPLFEGPFTTAARLVGATALLLAMMDDPALVRHLLARVAEGLIAFGRALAAAGADAILLPDPVSSTDLVSPEQSAEVAAPERQRLIAALPVPVLLHVCGNTAPILGTLGQSGARCLSLDQCMDLGRARQAVGWGISLGGNVDPVGLMEHGRPEEVLAAARAAIAAAGPRHFILMTGCAIPPGSPLENVRALVAACRAGAPGTAA
jgi:[methyl-Co(III) methanol-specific corrinoid protein]:coenzyme M methyltransferase